MKKESKQKNISLAVLVITAALILGFGLGYGYLNLKDKDQSNDTQQTVATNENGESANTKNCLEEDCLNVDGLEYPAGELPAEVVTSLNRAIDDEYKAHATYDAVIAKLGPIRPFSMIIRAEEQHIASLKAIYDKYGVTVPEDPYSNLEVANTKAENCSVGVQAEIDNAALYRDQLLPTVTAYPDITSVFTNLMNASQNKHLPAFQKCAG